jgi:ubiquinone/menaquinone biosynthesis C-methylase UbiE
MKVNRTERWFVNSPFRRVMQYLETAWFTRVYPLETGGRILEIGCGGGAGAELIVANYRPQTLHLMDLDPLMLAKAKARLVPRSGASFSFSVGDAARLPYHGDRMDAVFGFGVLHHVPLWQKSLQEVARVLKPGGIYFMVEFYPGLYQNVVTRRILVHPESNRFESLDLLEMFERVNLQLARTFELKHLGILGVGVKGGAVSLP